jgi:hypothetical protein
MKVKEPTAWVVYTMTQSNKGGTTGNSVCSQSEWDAMDAGQPGHHTLLRANIRNEAEAERLARELQAPLPAKPKPKSRIIPLLSKGSAPDLASNPLTLPALS